MIRNIRFYRIHSDWPETENLLSDELAKSAFKPCGSFNERSKGFEPPVDNAGDLMCRRLAGADLIQLRLQSRILPAAAVREALEERLVTFVARTGRDPSRKEKRDMKEDVYGELLPKALLKSERIRAFYLRDESMLAVASAGTGAAEHLLEALRDALGSLEAIPLEYKLPAHGLLKRVFLGESPAGFTMGRECKMRDLAEPKSTVSWLDIDLADSTVRAHVKSGMDVERLAIHFDGVVSCTLDQDLVVRKLKLEGVEELDDLDDEDPLARHDAEFTLVSGLVSRLLGGLKKELKGYAA